MKVIAIAAVGKNGVMGNGLDLPWDIPEDMNFFREATKNHIVIMGRKTLDALGKPLPKRENAVITRDPKSLEGDARAKGALIFSDLKTAIDHYQSREKEFPGKIIFVIGGAQIYELSLPMLDEVWLTEIDAEFPGDIFFPFYRNGRFERPEFELTGSRPQKDLTSPYRYRFNEFHRKT